MIIERSKNTVRNVLWGTMNKVITLILPFIARTILLKILGEQYLGLNGLFSSILQVLNLTDLGFSTAVVYSMYKPIAEDDADTICALLAFYKKVYRIIGTVILFLGIIIMPFLRYLIKGNVPKDINIYLVYLIYLLNTVLSYWLFAYKSSLLSAHQRNDISSKINSVIIIAQYIIQISLVWIFKNYYLYLLAFPLLTILSNISISLVVKKNYPDYVCRGEISSDIKNGIKKQVSGLFLSKLCGTTRNSLDSVFISSFLGLTQVAIYGNYYYVLNSVHTLLGVFSTSVLGGIGNSVAKETQEKNYLDFKRLSFLYSWVAGWCACCMFCLYQHFMNLWVGEKLVFPFSVMILFCLYFYFVAATDIKNIYIDACGLWWENRRRSVLETIVNFILNLTLGYFFGVYGILLATLITMLSINLVYGIKILYDNYFKTKSIFKYFLRIGFYFAVTILVSIVTYLICDLLPDSGYVSLGAKVIICIIVPNVLFFLCYFKTKMFLSSKEFVLRVCSSLFTKLHLKKSV